MPVPEKLFIGDVVVFDKAEKVTAFERRLRAAMEQKPPSGTTYGVRVIAYFLDEKALARIAQERGSAPYPGAAIAFLNTGAVHACSEFGITYEPSNALNKTLPSWAVPTIDQMYRSKSPYAGADPR